MAQRRREQRRAGVGRDGALPRPGARRAEATTVLPGGLGAARTADPLTTTVRGTCADEHAPLRARPLPTLHRIEQAHPASGDPHSLVHRLGHAAGTTHRPVCALVLGIVTESGSRSVGKSVSREVDGETARTSV